jgi:hypothetical protein
MLKVPNVCSKATIFVTLSAMGAKPTADEKINDQKERARWWQRKAK